jgi:ABC-type dipeptide/oligopeptide/nickel transport system permease component
MFSFLIRRISLGILTLFAVISLTFILVRMMPGGPFDKDRKISAAIEKALLAKYKLDGTLGEQYGEYLRDVFRGDLGLSTKYRNRTINEILAQTLPVSMALGSIAFVLALSLGITLGSVSAVYHQSILDRSSMLVVILAISIPNFVLAPLATLLFAIHYHLLPVAGWGELKHLVLPSIFLSLPFAAYIARMMRISMLEILGQDYIRTARAKGLDEFRIVLRHALKIAILPVVSFAGPLAANILTGSLVIEEIFKIPGVGGFFVNGVLNRDVFLVGGIVVVYSSLLIAFNIIVDILYTFLDRRIRLQ